MSNKQKRALKNSPLPQLRSYILTLSQLLHPSPLKHLSVFELQTEVLQLLVPAQKPKKIKIL